MVVLRSSAAVTFSVALRRQAVYGCGSCPSTMLSSKTCSFFSHPGLHLSPFSSSGCMYELVGACIELSFRTLGKSGRLQKRTEIKVFMVALVFRRKAYRSGGRLRFGFRFRVIPTLVPTLWPWYQPYGHVGWYRSCGLVQLMPSPQLW